MDIFAKLARWSDETERYASRIQAIAEWRPDLPKGYDTYAKGFHLAYEGNADGFIALRYSVFASQMFVATRPLADSIISLWRAGLIGSVALPARMVLEVWGASCFARHGLQAYLKTRDIQVAAKKTTRLLRGVRSQFEEPWGGLSQHQSYNVQSFVDALAAQEGHKWDEEYAYLCESCHPSCMQIAYWGMAGPWFNNLSNERFRERFHRDIDRLLASIESSLPGIVRVVEDVFQMAEPLIDSEVQRSGGGLPSATT